jgi:heat-inducible transcriptional repressor
VLEEEISAHRTELDELTGKVVEAGLATQAGAGRALIVRGQAQLLADVTALEQLETIRALFERLEAKETLLKLLELAQASDGVQIFIGSENRLFEAAGVTMIVAPYRNARDRIVGAIGVIGPTRINYGRIIPAVDYTAKVIGRLLG